MGLIDSIPPSGGAAGGASVFNATPQVVAASIGAAGAGPTAQQLLQTAVVASAFIPSYSEQQPKQPKPVLRNPSNAPPSSALAAQLLAQTPEADEEMLAIFTPQSAPQPQEAHSDAVGSWQGSAQAYEAAAAAVSPEATAASSAQAMASAVAQNKLATTVLAQGGGEILLAADRLWNGEQHGVAPQSSLQQTIGGKKNGIVLARGTNAYVSTATRNSTVFTRAAVEAVS